MILRCASGEQVLGGNTGTVIHALNIYLLSSYTVLFHLLTRVGICVFCLSAGEKVDSECRASTGVL